MGHDATKHLVDDISADHFIQAGQVMRDQVLEEIDREIVCLPKELPRVARLLFGALDDPLVLENPPARRPIAIRQRLARLPVKRLPDPLAKPRRLRDASVEEGREFLALAECRPSKRYRCPPRRVARASRSSSRRLCSNALRSCCGSKAMSLTGEGCSQHLSQRSAVPLPAKNTHGEAVSEKIFWASCNPSSLSFTSSIRSSCAAREMVFQSCSLPS